MATNNNDAPASKRSLSSRLVEVWRRFVEGQQLRLASAEALPQLALLGIVSGLLAGMLIILFRWLVDSTGTEQAFENLSPAYRFGLIMVGTVAIGLLFHFTPAAARQVGVVHVITRLNYHQGYLPLRNAVVQFIGAALSLICGHSVGREGPNVHVGAASASLLGRRLGLPNNSVRTLVGCGVAAAIAAGFNTPLAGVIFAMEVVLMEYTIAGFAPIILAAVCAAALSRFVYGEDAVFFVPQWEWNSVAELPYVLILGIVIGALAALFTRLTMWFSLLATERPIWLRMAFGGLVMGAIAVPVPQTMGVGYDTVNAALLGQIGLGALAAVTLAKILATSACVGFGSPGGLIAPTLVIGAGAGGAIGLFANLALGSETTHGFYALLGMGAMMGATLQAPLAALIAMLELTANPNIILPGMIAVVSAALINRVVFGQSSIYRQLMLAQGLDYRNDPLAQALRRIGVASVMDRNIARIDQQVNRAVAQLMVKDEPNWILVFGDDGPIALLPTADLALFLGDETEAPSENLIDLMEIPAKRQDLTATTIVASLQEAVEQLEKSGKEALYVTGARGMGANKVYGILTQSDIEKAHRS